MRRRLELPLERFLTNEADYCSRFGYDGLLEECLDENQECQRKWFPVLSFRGRRQKTAS